MKKVLSLLLVSAIGLSACKKDKEEKEGYTPRPVTAASKKFISKIYEYLPAPGQFINESLGSPENAEKLVGDARTTLVSLGGFGGSLTFGFDHSIENINGADLGIYGNPLTGTNAEWSEAGIVMVMQDLNNNGIPDDGTWYELAGSEHGKPETIKNYKITYYNPKNMTDDVRWTDNQGKEGYVLRNIFHNKKEYYPSWIKDQDQVSFTGTLLKNTLHDGPIITNKPFEWGYADNGSADYKQLMDDTGSPYNSFDISWAVDGNGNKIDLPYIDFVKVYTGQNSNGNPYEPDKTNPRSRYLGEVSTEIGGAIDLKIHLNK